MRVRSQVEQARSFRHGGDLCAVARSRSGMAMRIIVCLCMLYCGMQSEEVCRRFRCSLECRRPGGVSVAGTGMSSQRTMIAMSLEIGVYRFALMFSEFAEERSSAVELKLSQGVVLVRAAIGRFGRLKGCCAKALGVPLADGMLRREGERACEEAESSRSGGGQYRSAGQRLWRCKRP